MQRKRLKKRRRESVCFVKNSGKMNKADRLFLSFGSENDKK